MQTLTIREAETQLQSLVNQTHVTHQSVILTNDIATPLAVLTPFIVEKPDNDAALVRRLEILEGVIQMWQQHCANGNVSHDARQLFQSQLRQLGSLDLDHLPAYSALVMLLRLAMRQVQTPTPRSQVDALALGVNVLRSPNCSWQEVEAVDQQLLKSGIDARADFGDEELVRSYVDAS